MLSIVSFGSVSLKADKKDKQENYELKFDENGNQYIYNILDDEKIYEAFKFDKEGNFISKDLSEYKDELNERDKYLKEFNEKFENEKVEEKYLEKYAEAEFIKTQTISKVLGESIKISADIIGPGTISTRSQMKINDSFSLSGKIASCIKTKIKQVAPFKWENSLKMGYKNNYEISLQVNEKKLGYLSFTPYFKRVYGDVYNVIYNPAGIKMNRKYAGIRFGDSPKVLKEDFCDGIYSIIYYEFKQEE